jgi:stress-induced morphogen
MITNESLIGYIRKAMPDAVVKVYDKTGMMEHFVVHVVSTAFEGKNLLDRNRLVYAALSDPMREGRIHAVEIKAETPGPNN